MERRTPRGIYTPEAIGLGGEKTAAEGHGFRHLRYLDLNEGNPGIAQPCDGFVKGPLRGLFEIIQRHGLEDTQAQPLEGCMLQVRCPPPNLNVAGKVLPNVGESTPTTIKTPSLVDPAIERFKIQFGVQVLSCVSIQATSQRN